MLDKKTISVAWYGFGMSSVGLPEFRRAEPADALDVACRLFAADERVDMATLADRLAIGRSTLYRWVGDRDRLMGKVVVASIGEIWIDARAASTGRGVDRSLDSARRFMVTVVDHAGLRGFVNREPNLALRVLMDPEGLVGRALAAGIGDAVGEDTGVDLAHTDVFAVLGHLATALVWGNVAAGLDPQVESIVRVMRDVIVPLLDD